MTARPGGRPAPGSEVSADGVDARMTVVGNATVLLHLGPFTILTDPCFLHAGEHAPLGYGLRSRRLREPAIGPDELPPLDAVVLSHHHGDHFDERAAAGLPRDVPIVTTRHAARKLQRQGFTGTVPLDTWEAHELRRGEDRVRITAVPAQHGPTGLDRLLPPVMGSVLEWIDEDGREVRTLHITGDTVVHGGLAEIRDQYPAIDCCLVHLGGTRVLGVLLTLDGEGGRRALEILQPRTAVPIHVDDFTVQRSGLGDFLAATARPPALPVQVVVAERGQEVPLPGW